MPFVIDRFEDNDRVVLETSEGESMILPRSHLPWYASEGDVLLELPKDKWQGEIRYAVDEDETAKRLEQSLNLRASLPKADEGDIEL